MTDRIAELETERDEQVAKDFEEWKAGVEKDLADARAAMAENAHRPASRAYKAWKEEVDRLEAELADAEKKRDELAKVADGDMKEKIETEARELYPEVLDAAAAAAAGFSVRELPAYPVGISSRPRFSERYPEDIQFLFGNAEVRELKEGESSELLDDTTGRALHLAVAVRRETGTVAHLTRRELATARKSFAQRRLAAFVAQSFTLEALEERWHYERLRPEGEEIEPQANTGSGSEKPK
jgi:hypothetical protein